MSWLIQGLLTNLVWEILFAVVAILIAILKKRGSAWATPALYGAGVFALLIVILVGIRGIAAIGSLPQSPSPITADNAESKVRTWLDDTGLSVGNFYDPESNFNFTVTYDEQPERHINIYELKDDPKYLYFETALVITSDTKTQINKLSSDKKDELVAELVLALAQSRCLFQTHFPDRVVVNERILINEYLNQEVLYQNMADVEKGFVIADSRLNLSLHNVE